MPASLTPAASRDVGRPEPDADGGPCGFQRLSGLSHALAPLDLRALLDPQPEDRGRGNVVHDGLTQAQVGALETVKGVARAVTFRDADAMRWGSERDLAFALAVHDEDSREPGARLGAILARAYHRADCYAGACAEEFAIKAEVQPLISDLDRALKALGGKGPLWYKGRVGTHLEEGSTASRAINAVGRMGYHGRDRIEALRKGIADGAEAVERVCDLLCNMRDQGPVYGWPEGDEARFFFLLRLAEMFTISTGIVPVFSGYRPKPQNRAVHWTDFARAALDLTGLGTRGFDDLSRCLGGKRPKHITATIEEHYGSIIEGMAQWFTEEALNGPYRGQRRAGGQLLTAGRAIDRKDGGEPHRWGDHREDFREPLY